MLHGGKLPNASYQQIAVLSAPGLALFFLVGLGVGRKPPPVRQTLLLPCVHGGATVRMGTKAKPLVRIANGFAVAAM
jgi:hypothetical protein